MKTTEPSNAELEARIAANPDDDAAWQVYADWLNEQGSPRGELAALHLAYEKKALPSLRQKAEALIAKQFAAPELDLVKWKAGFWQRIAVRDDFDVLANPSARLCQRMTLTSSDDDHSPAAEALAEHGPFPALRRLTIGADPEYGQSDYDSYLDIRSCHGLARLPAVLPNLRMLSLRVIEDFDFASFPNLETLTILAVTPKVESLRALFAIDLPKLRRLKLDLGTMNAEATDQLLSASDFTALASGKHVPRLAKLEIHATSNDDALVPNLEKLFAKSRAKCTIDDAVSM